MAVKVTANKNSSLTILYVKKLMAGLVVLSFLVITACVLGTEASLEHQVYYITFDSMLVYVAIRFFQWVVIRVLTVYEEIDGGKV